MLNPCRFYKRDINDLWLIMTFFLPAAGRGRGAGHTSQSWLIEKIKSFSLIWNLFVSSVTCWLWPHALTPINRVSVDQSAPRYEFMKSCWTSPVTRCSDESAFSWLLMSFISLQGGTNITALLIFSLDLSERKLWSLWVLSFSLWSECF